MLAIRWALDDMALAYSQQLAMLLTMLLDAQANTMNSRAMLPLTISGHVHKLRHQFHVLAALVSV